MLDPALNFARVTPSLVAAGVTTVNLASGEGAELPQPSADGAFNLVWWNFSDYKVASDDPNKEIVRVTARSTDQLTVTRAQEGTADTDKNIAGKIYKMGLAYTKKLNDDLKKYVPGLEENKTISSATTTDLGSIASALVEITGVVTITSFGIADDGVIKFVKFDNALVLTHHATSLILPDGVNITTVAGDSATFVSLGGGNWKCLSYQTKKASNAKLAAGVDDSDFTTVAGIVHLLGNLTSAVATYFTSTRTAKTTPVDADSIMLCDSADSDKDKKMTIANLQEQFLAMVARLTASANLYLNLSGEDSVVQITSYTKKKEVRVNKNGSIRITFEGKYSSTGVVGGYGRIYINGIAVGTEREFTTTDYVETASQDFNVGSGDLVQLYLRAKSTEYGTTTYAQNFKIYCDESNVDTIQTLNA